MGLSQLVREDAREVTINPKHDTEVGEAVYDLGR